jgi:amidophosphoribosyltransferase
MPGDIAIGHIRYTTKGDAHDIRNVQPIQIKEGLWFAHNGTLQGTSLNLDDLSYELEMSGVDFYTGTDTEVFAQRVLQHKGDLIEGIRSTARDIPLAFSFLIWDQKSDRVIAMRDPYGVRPLSIAKMGEGYLVCSENYAFDQYPECEYLREIDPGELVYFRDGNMCSMQYIEPQEQFCIFEGIYFSDPRSRYNNIYHEDFRFELGKKIYEENHDLIGHCIIPVLDSGKQAALGLSRASGIPYREYFKRQHNPPRSNLRSFTSPTQEERVRTAYQKLHLRKEKVYGKDVIVVDDSIVRSTTMSIIVQRLRDAGARTVTVCISCPPIKDVCPFGIDFQTKDQLVANTLSVDAIGKKIGADRLVYLSLDGLHEVVREQYQCGICSGCFGGSYAGRV